MGGTGDMGGNPSSELCFPSCTGMQYLFPSLAFTNSRKQVACQSFFRVTFSLEIIGHPGQGCVPQDGPLVSSPSQPHLSPRLTLGHVRCCGKHSDLFLCYACHPACKWLYHLTHLNAVNLCCRPVEAGFTAAQFTKSIALIYIIASVTALCLPYPRYGLETLHCSLFYCYTDALSSVNRWKVLYIGQLF